MTDEIKHYGVVGMHWGIRRYQNPDGTLTPEGKIHYGIGMKGYSAISEKANKVYGTLTDEEKYHLTGSPYSGNKNFDDKYEYNDDSYKKATAFSLIYEMKDVPISVFDIYEYKHDKNIGIVSIAVRNEDQYRGKGLAKNSVKKGLEWFENNSELTQLDWAAFADNYASQKLAEEMGFEFNKDSSDDLVYVYSKYK